MNICKIKRSTQIAIMTGAGSGAVEKTATGTTPLTLSDSVDGTILGITVNGHSEAVEGEIKSVGDDGLTVTTANNDSTVTTSANITTALPLRGVSDTIKDKLTCTADVKQAETVCGEVDLGDLTWEYLDYVQYGYKVFRAPVSGMAIKTSAAEAISGLLCENYPLSSRYSYVAMENKSILRDYVDNKSIIVIKDADYSDATTFKAAMSGVMLVYELATPTVTPLTDAEISAFRGLRTYDPTTVISVTDNPSITVNYMGKRTTRTAPKKRTSRKKK